MKKKDLAKKVMLSLFAVNICVAGSCGIALAKDFRFDKEVDRTNADYEITVEDGSIVGNIVGEDENRLGIYNFGSKIDLQASKDVDISVALNGGSTQEQSMAIGSQSGWLDIAAGGYVKLTVDSTKHTNSNMNTMGLVVNGHTWPDFVEGSSKITAGRDVVVVVTGAGSRVEGMRAIYDDSLIVEAAGNVTFR